MPVNYIDRFVHIQGKTIFKNGEKIFQGIDVDLEKFSIQTYKHLGIDYPKFFKMDKVSRWGFLAAELLVRDNPLLFTVPAEEVGIILSNASGSMDADLEFLKSTEQIASPALFVYTLPNIVIGELCIRHGFKGENSFFVMDRFDSQWIGFQVDYTLNEQQASVCLAGWVEVMQEEADVFLYLAHKNSGKGQMEHTGENIGNCYQINYGKSEVEIKGANH